LRKLCGLIAFCSAFALGLIQIGGEADGLALAPGAAQAADPPTPLLVVEGVGKGFPCVPGQPTDPTCTNGQFDPGDNGYPPDVNGDVGLNHYVQAVNSSYAVFSKSDGVPVEPAKRIQTLWQGYKGGGHPCETSPHSDPYVRFDRTDVNDGRWIITQPAITDAGPTIQCFAVSQSSDPTLLWHRYDFPIHGDYAKIGRWPTGNPQTDAYYVTLDWGSGTTVCALQRLKMLQGAAAGHVCDTVSVSDERVLPSDADGATPPPDSPNYLISTTPAASSTLLFWKAQVQWGGVTATLTVTAQDSIAVAEYVPLPVEVPQLGGTGLNSHGDKIMNRFAYRNFGSHESFVVSHAVDADTDPDPDRVRGGVRWYELRCAPVGSCQPQNALPGVHRWATYAPSEHGNHWRWMSSLAMDRLGNIALGYNVSSSSIYAGIRFSGIDKNGTQLPEGVLQPGLGPYNNWWGDYVSMSVDPFDQCTFWYTNQYAPASLVPPSKEFQTKIAKFKLDETACV
jgi:hypothetical protein